MTQKIIQVGNVAIGNDLPFVLFAQFSMTASIIGLAEGIVKEFPKKGAKENAIKSLNLLRKRQKIYKHTLIEKKLF